MTLVVTCFVRGVPSAYRITVCSQSVSIDAASRKSSSPGPTRMRAWRKSSATAAKSPRSISSAYRNSNAVMASRSLIAQERRPPAPRAEVTVLHRDGGKPSRRRRGVGAGAVAVDGGEGVFDRGVEVIAVEGAEQAVAFEEDVKASTELHEGDVHAFVVELDVEPLEHLGRTDVDVSDRLTLKDHPARAVLADEAAHLLAA